MCIRDRFYTEEEQDRFDNIDPIAIREALEERGIVNGQEMCIRDRESMVFDSQEIMDHGGLFGVDREEWEKSPQFHDCLLYTSRCV